MINFEAHTNDERTQMLKDLGLATTDDLYKNLPVEIKTKGLNLLEPYSELKVTQEIK